jgi:hypothetical protein
MRSTVTTVLATSYVTLVLTFFAYDKYQVAPGHLTLTKAIF